MAFVQYLWNKAALVKDTSYKGLWKVSFTLKEFQVQIIDDYLQDVLYN